MFNVSRRAAVIVAFFALLCFPGCSDDCPTCPTDEAPGAASLTAQIMHPQPGPDYYRDLYVAGPNDVFVCAASGAVFRWQGSDWTRFETGSPYALRAIWGSSANDVFAVGEQGTVVHFNGSSWSEIPTNVLYDLDDVWGTAPDSVYAVGYNGIIIHYDGSEWSEVATGLTKDNRYFTAVWAVGNTVFVGGYGYIPNYAGLIWRYDGSAWTETLVPEPVETFWGFAPDSVFAGGQNGLFSFFDGSTWSSQPQPSCNIMGMWGTAADNIWVAGIHWNGSSWVGGLFNYDGFSWSQSPEAFDYYIYSVGGASVNEIYLVGDAEQLARYDGSAWTGLNTNLVTTRSLRAVWGNSTTDVWLLGSEGAIFHYDGSTLTDHSGVTGKHIYDAWGAAPDDIYAVGSDGLILNYDGVEWTEENHGLPIEYFHTIWGTSANDVWIGRDNGMLAHFDGATWTEHSITHITNRTVTDLWGSSESDYYAIVGNRALHYDGTTWSVLSFDGEYLNSVHGVSANRVFFAAGVGGGQIFGSVKGPQEIGPPVGESYLIIYDGSGYSKINIGFSGQISQVWALGANNVFLLGRGSAPSTILHFNGHAFAKQEIATPMWVYDMWGTGTGTVYAVGDRGLFIRATAN